LLARVRMILRRTSRDLDANPLTHLPGNVSIFEELQSRLNKQQPFSVCYIDLDKFKAYNDKYGFENGDKVIKESARLLLRAVQQNGNPDDFLGHIGGDDFVITTTEDKVDAICKEVIRQFDKLSPSFYNQEDRENGYIATKDRKGNMQKVPLLSVSIGVVTNAKELRHVARIGEIGAEIKEGAKRLEKSNYIKDRRT
jgi:diguanylate cyclase (GGDEF)-like protein